MFPESKGPLESLDDEENAGMAIEPTAPAAMVFKACLRDIFMLSEF
jgi:hypothetical protein